MNFSRQTGKTHVCCLYILRDIIKKFDKNKTLDWICVTTTEKRAKECLRLCKELMIQLNAEILRPEGKEIKFIAKIESIEFENGSRILITTSQPDNLRGYSASVYIDEASYISKWEEVWNSIDSMRDADYENFRVLVSSTPRGSGNLFHFLWHTDLGDLPVGHFECDIHRARALSPDLVKLHGKNFIENKQKTRSPSAFRRDYECSWEEGNEDSFIEKRFLIDKFKDGSVSYITKRKDLGTKEFVLH